MSPPLPHRLSFICTANICRSPMAEGLARHYGAERGWAVEARSAGIMGLIGHDANPPAVKAMAEIGLDISAHQSSAVTDELVAWSDWLLVMELRHQMDIHQRFPAAEGKVLMLGHFGGIHEIEDPYGGWRWKFRRSRDTIKRCVERFMDQLPPPAQGSSDR